MLDYLGRLVQTLTELSRTAAAAEEEEEEEGGANGAVHGMAGSAEAGGRGDKMYMGESLLLVLGRWSKLRADLYSHKKRKWDLSKLPDIYDNAKFDTIHHNFERLGMGGVGAPGAVAAAGAGASPSSSSTTTWLDEFYELSRHFANYVVPQEYGFEVAQKRLIGISICRPLLAKICLDIKIGMLGSAGAFGMWGNQPGTPQLNASERARVSRSGHESKLEPMFAQGIKSVDRMVRTRLYFTSESLLHTLLNVLRTPLDFGGEEREGDGGGRAGPQRDNCLITPEAMDLLAEVPELDYLTTFVFKVRRRRRRRRRGFPALLLLLLLLLPLLLLLLPLLPLLPLLASDR